jgi:hypothetical protein
MDAQKVLVRVKNKQKTDSGGVSAMPFLYMTTHILKGLEVMLHDLALLLKCQLDIKLIKLCFLFVLRGAHA